MNFLMVIMASGIVCDARTHDHDNDHDGVAQDGGHASAHRLTKTCTLHLYWKYAIFSWRAGFSKKKEISSISTNYSGGSFNVFNKGCT